MYGHAPVFARFSLTRLLGVWRAINNTEAGHLLVSLLIKDHRQAGLPRQDAFAVSLIVFASHFNGQNGIKNAQSHGGLRRQTL
jgi:hypothetical protein